MWHWSSVSPQRSGQHRYSSPGGGGGHLQPERPAGEWTTGTERCGDSNMAALFSSHLVRRLAHNHNYKLSYLFYFSHGDCVALSF